jgi:uncharacterized protein (TIGR02996 family)
MDERAAALIRQIAADPHDRALRLVLADLYLELDDPRAEMIQLAEQLRGLHPMDREAEVPAARLAELHATHAALIAGDIPGVLAVDGGFVDTVELDPDVFRARGDALFATHPIRKLVSASVDLGPGLARVRAFTITPAPWALAVAWDRLESLRLAESALANSDPPFFAQLRAPRLRSLTVARGTLGPRELGAMFDRLPELESFELVYTQPLGLRDNVIDMQFRTLKPCPDLRVLRLDAGFGGDERVANLVDKAPNLERVWIADRVGTRTCKALARCARLAELTLNVERTSQVRPLLAKLPLRDVAVRGERDVDLEKVPTSRLRRLMVAGRPLALR